MAFHSIYPNCIRHCTLLEISSLILALCMILPAVVIALSESATEAAKNFYNINV